MRKMTLTRWLWTLLLVLVAGLQLLEQANRPPEKTPAPQASEMFETLRNARLVDDPTNDGDSFKVEHDGGVQVFRLHFVDCPEKRDYKLVNGRLKDQAAYFGGISVARTLRVAKKALEFTESLLRAGNFTVHTRWRQVYDHDRFYAVIFFPDGEELSEKLVRAGLCRIYTTGTILPDGRDEFTFEKHLRALEREARTAGRGAWGGIK